MKTLSALLLATVLVALPTSCKSTKTHEVPCVCGTEYGDLEGCANSTCREGKSNPNNPNCVCGGIEVPQAKKN